MWVRSQNKKILIDAHCFTIKFSNPHTCLYADGVLVGKYKKQSDAEEILDALQANIWKHLVEVADLSIPKIA